MKLHYLTVQDILWINLQATKKVQHFSHARLEEATFYQYAYGDSQELLGQAARFLGGFVRMSPLDAGVEATAFLAVAAFLIINGSSLQLEDVEGTSWFRRATASTEAARDALAGIVETEASLLEDHHPDVRAAVRAAMACYPQTTQSLLSIATTV